MPTGTPCVPHCDSSDLVPVNGNMPPTTSVGDPDVCLDDLTEPKAPAATVAAVATASARAIIALRRNLTLLIRSLLLCWMPWDWGLA